MYYMVGLTYDHNSKMITINRIHDEMPTVWTTRCTASSESSGTRNRPSLQNVLAASASSGVAVLIFRHELQPVAGAVEGQLQQLRTLSVEVGLRVTCLESHWLVEVA